MNTPRTMGSDDANAVLERHRGLFKDAPRQHAVALVVPLGFAGFTAFAIWWLAIPFSQIGQGLASLAKFIGLMFPPSTGGHLDLLRRPDGAGSDLYPHPRRYQDQLEFRS